MRKLAMAVLPRAGLAVVMGLAAVVTTGPAQAGTPDIWAVEADERLEIVRDYRCFGSGEAGTRKMKANARFDGEVQEAEVFVSGFNLRYTDGGSHGVAQQRVDTFVEVIGAALNECRPRPGHRCAAWYSRHDPRSVGLELVYALADASESGTTDACIAFTVLARTR